VASEQPVPVEASPPYPRISEAIRLLVGFALLTILFDIPVFLATPRQSAARFVGASAVTLLVMAAVVRHACRRIGRPAREILPLRRVSGPFFAAWILLLFGTVLLTLDLGALLQTLLPKSEHFQTLERRFISGYGSPVAGFLVIVLAGPVMEELLFRGVLLYGFLGNYSRRKAIVASSALFAVYHLNPWQALAGFFLGLLFGYWRATTCSLVPGIVGHMLFNSLAFFARLHAAGRKTVPSPPPSLSFAAGLALAASIFLAAGIGLHRKLRPDGSE
jgi:membrane protease YdiL (CAAX protease family)